MTTSEYRTICKMIMELEVKFNKKLDGFGEKFIGMLKGFSILNPEKQTMTTEEVCREYGVSKRKLCDMRKKGLIPFTKHGDAPNSKVTYRIADVAEVFSSRDEF